MWPFQFQWPNTSGGEVSRFAKFFFYKCIGKNNMKIRVSLKLQSLSYILPLLSNYLTIYGDHISRISDFYFNIWKIAITFSFYNISSHNKKSWKNEKWWQFAKCWNKNLKLWICDLHIWLHNLSKEEVCMIDFVILGTPYQRTPEWISLSMSCFMWLGAA